MRAWFVTAAILGGLGVIAGAFGEHMLASRVDPRALQVFRTATSYQMYHALAIGLAALAMPRAGAWASRAAIAFLVGIILFSGSLYLWVLTGSSVVVFMPPLGGTALIIGWGLLAVAGWKLEER